MYIYIHTHTQRERDSNLDREKNVAEKNNVLVHYCDLSGNVSTISDFCCTSCLVFRKLENQECFLYINQQVYPILFFGFYLRDSR